MSKSLLGGSGKIPFYHPCQLQSDHYHRQADFISGLPVNPVADTQLLSNAERIRLIHSHITSTPKDGGLGISPDAPEWDLVESIFPLHDREFNKHWIKAWKPRTKASIELDRIRHQFGDSIALYFAFLSSYTSFLVVLAVLGLVAYFLFPPYSPVYSILLSIWSITFVEWWRIHERILSLRFGTRGSFRVEKRRVQYKPGMSWWVRELRVLASIPIIILFGGLLSALLTMIFVFEAFVTELYQGPGKQLIVNIVPSKPIYATHSCILELFAHSSFRHSSSTRPGGLSGYRRRAHKLGKPRTQINLHVFSDFKNICSQRSSCLHGSRSHRICLRAIRGRRDVFGSRMVI